MRKKYTYCKRCNRPQEPRLCDICIEKEDELLIDKFDFMSELDDFEKSIFSLIFEGYSYRFVKDNILPVDTKYTHRKVKPVYDLLKSSWGYFLQERHKINH